MPFNGSGQFNLTISLTPGDTARAEDVQAALVDLAAGLSDALTRDGQSIVTGNIDLGGYALENVAAGTGLLPAGTPLPWLSSNVPSGFLLAYGQEVSQTAQAGIFAVFGSTFNNGKEAAGNFRMPDLRGRLFAGLDNIGGTPASVLTGFGASGQTLGATGGEQTHALLAAELAAHSHTIADSGHSHSVNDPGHAHQYVGPAAGPTSGSAGGTYTATQNYQTGGSTTGITVGNAKTGISGTDSAGASAAHNNIQPTMLCNWIIKT